MRAAPVQIALTARTLWAASSVSVSLVSSTAPVSAMVGTRYAYQWLVYACARVRMYVCVRKRAREHVYHLDTTPDWTVIFV